MQEKPSCHLPSREGVLWSASCLRAREEEKSIPPEKGSMEVYLVFFGVLKLGVVVEARPFRASTFCHRCRRVALGQARLLPTR